MKNIMLFFSLASVAVLASAISSSAFADARAYHMKMQVSKDGKVISSPQVIVKAGEPASITQENEGEKTFIEIVATPGASSTVKMQIHMSTTDANGKKTTLPTAQIVAIENQPAKLMQANSDGSENFSLSVIATSKRIAN